MTLIPLPIFLGGGVDLTRYFQPNGVYQESIVASVHQMVEPSVSTPSFTGAYLKETSIPSSSTTYTISTTPT